MLEQVCGIAAEEGDSSRELGELVEYAMLVIEFQLEAVRANHVILLPPAEVGGLKVETNTIGSGEEVHLAGHVPRTGDTGLYHQELGSPQTGRGLIPSCLYPHPVLRQHAPSSHIENLSVSGVGFRVESVALD